MCPSNQVSAPAVASASDEKMATFQLFFQSREQLVVRRGGIRRIGWVIKILEAQVDQFFLGCKCPVSRSIFVQEQDPFGDLPAVFFLQNVLQVHHQRWVILRVELHVFCDAVFKVHSFISFSAMSRIRVLAVISIAGVRSDFGRQNPVPVQHSGHEACHDESSCKF